MSTRNKYIVLCVLGLVLPYSQFLPWLWVHGFDLPLFVRELFANQIGGFFGWDVIVASYASIVFIVAEGRRLAVARLWLPIVGTCLVGVSFGLPLFLLMRHARVLESRDTAPSASVNRSELPNVPRSTT